MSKSNFQVMLCQLESTDDVDLNLRRVLALLSRSPEGTRLVVFPENSLFFRIKSGEPVQALTLEDPRWSQIIHVCEQKSLHVLLTTPMQRPHEKRVVNATLLLSPGKAPKIVYEKIHLFDVDVVGHTPVRESDSFQPGKVPAVIEMDGWRIGLSICYDVRFAELYTEYARQQVDVVVVPSAFLVPTGMAHWHVLLRARAIESQCFVLAPAQGGEHVSGEAVRRTFGHTLAVNPWGELVGEIAEPGEGVLSVTLDASELDRVRRQIPMNSHRRL